MMSKYVLVTFTVWIIASVLAANDSKEATLTNYEFVRGPSNSYHFEFDGTDGTSRQEEGTDDEEMNLAIDGSVSWVADDGSRYLMTFKADKKGYRPIIKRISGP